MQSRAVSLAGLTVARSLTIIVGMTPRMIRIVIADEQTIFRDGLRMLLESDPLLRVVSEASEPIAAVELVRQHEPDLLLLDLAMPNGGGLAALRELAREPVAATRVVILTAAIDRSEQMIAIQLGARGVVTKDVTTELLLKCVRCVVDGQYWLGHQTVSDLVDAIVLRPADHRPSKATLTARELDIVAAIVDGASNREIAEQFGLSPQTVKNHLSSIFDKLGVSNRLELALYAVNHRVLGERSGLR
jgi:two-component system, NarL family, nitrate/nitrite response regulator NarL